MKGKGGMFIYLFIYLLIHLFGDLSDEETKVGLTLGVQVFITLKWLQSSRATVTTNNAQREHHFCVSHYHIF